MASSRRIIQERFKTPDVKGEWEDSFVLVPTHVSTDADFRRFVAELNRDARNSGEFVRFRSVEREDVF